MTRFAAAAPLLLLLVGSPATTRAATVQFALATQVVSTNPADNSPVSASTAPYGTLTFTDTAPQQVQLLIQASLESPSEWFGRLVFSSNQGTSPGTCCPIQFTAGATTGSFTTPTLGSGFNNSTTNPPPGFDYSVFFTTTGNASTRFDGTDSIVYTITCVILATCGPAGANPLDATDFNVTNVDGAYPGWFAVVALGYEGTDFNGARYGDNTAADNVGTPGVIPEPTTLGLLGTGLVGLARSVSASRRRRSEPDDGVTGR
jgi:hypothetical protein